MLRIGSMTSSLSPSVKEKLNYLPLANIFTDTRVRVLIEKGFGVIKQQGRLDDKLRDYALQIAEMICEMCPGIFLNPNDVMTFCGTFMTSSSGENISTGDVVVHTVELDRGEGVVVKEGSSSTVQVELVLLFLLLNTSS